MYRDLEDRFGELPLPVRNLLEYARLRILGRARGVTAIERTRQGIDIKFHETARIDPERIVELVGRRKRRDICAAGHAPAAAARRVWPISSTALKPFCASSHDKISGLGVAVCFTSLQQDPTGLVIIMIGLFWL